MAIVENIRYSEITVKEAACPIFMVVTTRLRSGEANRHIGAIRQVTIFNLTSTTSNHPAMYPFRPQFIGGKAESTHRQCYVAEGVSCLGWRGTKPVKWTLPSHEAILTKLSPTRLRRRCLLVMHKPCDYKCAVFLRAP